MAVKVFGYASIPMWWWEKLHLTEDFILTGTTLQFHRGTALMSFRDSVITPQVQFGDEKPKKSKKHEAKYVWSSMA